MRNVKFVLAAIVLAIVPAGILATPAHAATRLGGVSVAGACFNQWPGSEVVLTGNNVMTWKCRFWSSVGPVYYGVNLTQQCRVQYGNSNAYATYADYNNPYSWSCYR